MDLNLSGTLTFNKYIFNTRKQEDNETIQDFANALVNLGNTVGADENLIVDRFVAGLKNDSARLGILQAPNEPFSLEVAVSLAKNNDQEAVLYTDQDTITVPVTAISNATTFDGYQVIVMPSDSRINDVTPKYPSGPGNVTIFNMSECRSNIMNFRLRLVW